MTETPGIHHPAIVRHVQRETDDVVSIGITPILSMIDAADAEGVDWRLIYLGRSRTFLPCPSRLERFGDRALLLPKSEVGPTDLSRTIEKVIDDAGFDRASTQLYVCGPGAVRESAAPARRRCSRVCPITVMSY